MIDIFNVKALRRMLWVHLSFTQF